jgi:hypothetical protein
MLMHSLGLKICQCSTSCTQVYVDEWILRCTQVNVDEWILRLEPEKALFVHCKSK